MPPSGCARAIPERHLRRASASSSSRATSSVLFFLMDHSTWDTWGAMLIGPVLFVAALPALARQARREGDRRVFWFLVAALAVKMLFSLFRWYHAFYVVETGGRARLRPARHRRSRTGSSHGNYRTGLSAILSDTNFIRLFTGIIYTVIRPSVIAGFLDLRLARVLGDLLLLPRLRARRCPRGTAGATPAGCSSCRRSCSGRRASARSRG